MGTTVTPAGRSFLARVRAEALPTTFRWDGRDWVALLAVPATLAVGWLVARVTDSLALGAIADTSLRILLFVVLVVANRELLARHPSRATSM